MSSVPVAPGEYVPTADERAVMHGVPWSHSTSAAFPELDLELLVSFLDRPTVTQAVRAYRKALG